MTDVDPVPVPGDPMAAAGRIVVGVDDSAHAQAALRWALREGVVRRAPVEAVHVWQPPLATLPFGATLPLSIDEGQIDATARVELDKVVDAAVAELGDEAPAVQRTVVPGSAALTLVDIANDADLLVVGSHGRTGLARLVMGSVATTCVQHASCPVVVVRLAGD
ncbi:MAG: universal stress protein [Acidimicrobiales bacterium]